MDLREKAWKHLLYYKEFNGCKTPIAEIKFSFLTKKVLVKNYTDNIFIKPFGVRKDDEITFKDLEDFLESRCFPKSRYNCKSILERLGIDHYDPFLIIKYNRGNCNEDNNYLEYVETIINESED